MSLGVTSMMAGGCRGGTSRLMLKAVFFVKLSCTIQAYGYVILSSMRKMSLEG
eukprot:gene35477-43741_t